MKKVTYSIFAMLAVTLGLLFQLKSDDNEVISDDPENLAIIVSPTTTDEGVKITFLDVGQGDASLIEYSNGVQLLVDCAVDGRIIEALGRVMPFYDTEIDYLLVTHSDLDHYGGCVEVMKRFKINNVIYNGVKKENDDSWVAFSQAIKDEGAKYTEINQEQTWEMGSSTWHFLYPDHSLVRDPKVPGQNKSDDNDTSIVFQLTNKQKNVIFMGDASEVLEKYLVNKYGVQLDSDILKVGHHGSGSSSGEEFLSVVTPSQAVISCGKNNRYGHPSLRVLKKLERVSSVVLRTDVDGDIKIEL